MVHANLSQDLSTRSMENYLSQELHKVFNKLLEITLFPFQLTPAIGIYTQKVFSTTVD